MSVKTSSARARRLSDTRVGRLVKFALVGISGLVVNETLVFALTEGIGTHYSVSAFFGTECSILWNFALSERWVFGGQRRARWRRLAWFASVNNVALLAQVPLLIALTEWLGLHYLLSNLMALSASMLVRFAIADTYIWKTRGADVELVESAGVAGLAAEFDLEHRDRSHDARAARPFSLS